MGEWKKWGPCRRRSRQWGRRSCVWGWRSRRRSRPWGAEREVLDELRPPSRRRSLPYITEATKSPLRAVGAVVEAAAPCMGGVPLRPAQIETYSALCTTGAVAPHGFRVWVWEKKAPGDPQVRGAGAQNWPHQLLGFLSVSQTSTPPRHWCLLNPSSVRPIPTAPPHCELSPIFPSVACSAGPPAAPKRENSVLTADMQGRPLFAHARAADTVFRRRRRRGIHTLAGHL